MLGKTIYMGYTEGKVYLIEQFTYRNGQTVRYELDKKTGIPINILSICQYIMLPAGTILEKSIFKEGRGSSNFKETLRKA